MKQDLDQVRWLSLPRPKSEGPKDLRKDSGVWENRLESLSSDSNRRVRQGKLAGLPFN